MFSVLVFGICCQEKLCALLAFVNPGLLEVSRTQALGLKGLLDIWPIWIDLDSIFNSNFRFKCSVKFSFFLVYHYICQLRFFLFNSVTEYNFQIQNLYWFLFNFPYSFLLKHPVFLSGILFLALFLLVFETSLFQSLFRPLCYFQIFGWELSHLFCLLIFSQGIGEEQRLTDCLSEILIPLFNGYVSVHKSVIHCVPQFPHL